MSSVAAIPGRIVPVMIIVQAAFLVATLDILSAFVDVWLSAGKTPSVVLRYVASGFFGSAAFSGGNVMQVYGLLFHYIIAFSWTFLFFWLYEKMPLMGRSRVITGIAFTVLLWTVMNMVVLPVSNVQHVPLSAGKPLKLFKSFLILLFMIGLPLSFIAGSIGKPVADGK